MGRSYNKLQFKSRLELSAFSAAFSVEWYFRYHRRLRVVQRVCQNKNADSRKLSAASLRAKDVKPNVD